MQELLGLSDDELCATLGVDPLTLLSGQLDHRPELGILLTLIDEAQVQAQAGPQSRSFRRRLRTVVMKKSPRRRHWRSGLQSCARRR